MYIIIKVWYELPIKTIIIQREMLGTLQKVPWAVVPQILPHIALYNHYTIHI